MNSRFDGSILKIPQKPKVILTKSTFLRTRKILKLHLNNFGGCSGFLLGDFVCHKSKELKNSLQNDSSLVHMMPIHYTSLLLPFVVGRHKPLKERQKKSATKWRLKRHDAFLPGQKIPSPKRKDILFWPKNICDSFPVKIVKKTLLSVPDNVSRMERLTRWKWKWNLIPIEYLSTRFSK